MKQVAQNHGALPKNVSLTKLADNFSDNQFDQQTNENDTPTRQARKSRQKYANDQKEKKNLQLKRTSKGR